MFCSVWKSVRNFTSLQNLSFAWKIISKEGFLEKSSGGSSIFHDLLRFFNNIQNLQ